METMRDLKEKQSAIILLKYFIKQPQWQEKTNNGLFLAKEEKNTKLMGRREENSWWLATPALSFFNYHIQIDQEFHFVMGKW